MHSVVALDQTSTLLAETGWQELQIDIADLIYAMELHEAFILTSAASLSPRIVRGREPCGGAAIASIGIEVNFALRKMFVNSDVMTKAPHVELRELCQFASERRGS